MRDRTWLDVVLVLYLAASLLHFAHNAEYVGDYPNLPAWLDRADVYLAWCVVAVTGVVGYVLYRGEWPLLGLLLLAVDTGFGFDGLLHYTRAPFAAHTPAMNFTIWFEVVCAALLLTVVVTLASARLRERMARVH
jgi:hypothetical protein